jgi:hypothetical protein
MPVVIFVREFDDVANCFWMAKGSRLTRLDVVKKMQSTLRHAVEESDAAAVDGIW